MVVETAPVSIYPVAVPTMAEPGGIGSGTAIAGTRRNDFFNSAMIKAVDDDEYRHARKIDHNDVVGRIPSPCSIIRDKGNSCPPFERN